jgi:hypothetical protein
MAAADVVVQGGSLLCSHGGTATVASGSTRLTVGSKGVLVSGGEIGLTFSESCVSAVPTAGVATKLTVGKMSVLLATSGGPTTNSQAGAGKWTVQSAGQTKLTAV